MNNKFKKHGKIFFLMISVLILLLAALSVGTTFGKYTTTGKKLDVKEDITISPEY